MDFDVCPLCGLARQHFERGHKAQVFQVHRPQRTNGAAQFLHHLLAGLPQLPQQRESARFAIALNLALRQLGTLRQGDQLVVLYGLEIVNGLVWIEVQDDEGRVGWIPQIYVLTLTPTATDTPTLTLTVLPETPTPDEFTVTSSPTP